MGIPRYVIFLAIDSFRKNMRQSVAENINREIKRKSSDFEGIKFHLIFCLFKTKQNFEISRV